MSQFRRARTAPALAGMVAATVVATSLSTPGPAMAAPPAPEGIWYTKGQDSIIKVKPCGNEAEAFCGFIVWLKEPNESDGTPKKDKLNKDAAKRDRPMLGLKILLDMKEDDDHWAGKAYNPEDGKKYSITFKVKEDDKADLRGCILGFLCQTETFTRAKEVPGGEPDLSASEAAPHKKHHKKNAETE